MKNRKIWTEEQRSLLLKMAEDKTPILDIARHFQCSIRTVTSQLWYIRKDTKPKPEDNLPQEKKDLVAYWRSEATRLGNALREARIEKTATQILVERVQEIAPVSYRPAPFIMARGKKKPKSHPQSAVLMLSDTHIGQVVTPGQTLGFGGYDFPTFLRRLKHLEQSVFSIMQDHTTTPIDELVVAILGDLVHGNLAHAVEAGQKNTLFTQFYSAGHAIAQFLRNLSTLAPLRIKTVVGNHPRWGTQKKMPTENRYSNLDMFLYAYVQALTRDIPGIAWSLDQQPFAIFDVQGFKFYAGHGDHMRGGDKMLGIPNHAVGRQISTNTQLFNRIGKQAPHYYLFGHFHRPITLPHALGEIIINGGFPGLDGFGLTEAFNPAYPSQKFFFVHPKFGRSACYDLRLDFADTEGTPYKLPTEFPCQ